MRETALRLGVVGGSGRRRTGITAACVLAGAVAVTTARMAWGQEAAVPPTSRAVASEDGIIGVNKIHVVFQVGSKSGEERQVESIKLIGKAPEGIAGRGDGTYVLSA